ncbi:MAG: hypothetical protein V4636_21325 [Pseudomonadota bacterium]
MTSAMTSFGSPRGEAARFLNDLRLKEPAPPAETPDTHRSATSAMASAHPQFGQLPEKAVASPGDFAAEKKQEAVLSARTKLGCLAAELSSALEEFLANPQTGMSADGTRLQPLIASLWTEMRTILASPNNDAGLNNHQRTALTPTLANPALIAAYVDRLDDYVQAVYELNRDQAHPDRDNGKLSPTMARASREIAQSRQEVRFTAVDALYHAMRDIKAIHALAADQGVQSGSGDVVRQTPRLQMRLMDLAGQLDCVDRLLRDHDAMAPIAVTAKEGFHASVMACRSAAGLTLPQLAGLFAALETLHGEVWMLLNRCMPQHEEPGLSTTSWTT